MALKAGAIRFNTDSGQLKIYDGTQWTEISASSTEQLTGGTRGVFGGSNNVMDYVQIPTTGDAIDFGDLSETFFINKALGGRIRGIFAGDRPSTNKIEFITFSSTGDSQDFGDLTDGREDPAGVSNGIRGCFGGGAPYPSNVNTIDYITIAQTGNAVDFGDLTRVTRHHGSC